MSTTNICPNYQEYNGTDKELAQLHECKKATNCYTNLVNYNNTISEYNSTQQNLLAAKLSAWSNKKEQYFSDLQAWENKTGSFSNWKDKENQLSSEQKLYKKCIYYDCNKSTKTNNEYCQKDHGPDWTHVNGKENKDGCLPGACRAYCKRTQESVYKELVNAGYISAKPVFNEIEPTQAKDYPLRVQNNTNVDIKCCSNYINTSGTVSGNISQSCGQELTKRLSALDPGQQENEEEQENEQEEQDYSTEIIIGIVVCILIIIISFLLLFLL
jgi:hypothetical protein